MADVGPPRHEIESDDEDDFNPLAPKRPLSKHHLDFEIVNSGLDTAETLIFASLEAGRWVLLNDLHLLTDKPLPQGFGPRAQTLANNWGLLASTRNACVMVNPSSMSSMFIMQVGMIFNPGWTSAIVVLSEAVTRLPLWAQYPYAEYVLDQFKPTKSVTVFLYPSFVCPDTPVPGFYSSTLTLHRVTSNLNTFRYTSRQ